METIKENIRYNNPDSDSIKLNPNKNKMKFELRQIATSKNGDSVIININKNIHNINNVQNYKIEGSYNNISLSQIDREEGTKSQMCNKADKVDNIKSYQRSVETVRNKLTERPKRVSYADEAILDCIKIENNVEVKSNYQALDLKSNLQHPDRLKIKNKYSKIHGVNPVSKSVHLKLLHNEMKRSKELEFKSLFESNGIKRDYLHKSNRYYEELKNQNNDLGVCQSANSYSNFTQNVCRPIEIKNSRLEHNILVGTSPMNQG